jgi:hypothetical protein
MKDVYIIATHFAKPKNPKKTSIPGYMKDPNNIVWDEQVTVTKGLRTKDTLSAAIVLNVTKQKVEFTKYSGESTFSELFNYFYEKSPNEITHSLQQVGFTLTPLKEEKREIDVPTETETS